MPLRSLFVDFNSYFASVEQHLRPELRGLPVAVVPVLTDSTCCIAASYEAKKYGIKTGTGAGEARKLCPGLRVVEARPELYVEMHHRLIAVVEDCIHVEQVLSIDEMACELTGRLQEKEAALALARKIKRELARQIGPVMTCSIGIAPNPFLAKTASDMQKPDGLVVIREEELPDCLHKLELRDFCGIGANMERRLHEKGIYTVRELCALDRRRLQDAWGSVEGCRMYDLLRGRLVPERPVNQRSISHSHVLPPEERNDSDAYAVLNRLLQKAAVRLRHMDYLAGGMAVSLKYPQDRRWDEELHFQETSDTLEFVRALEQLWQSRPEMSGGPMAVGVVLFRLVHEGNYTPSLFIQSDLKKRALNSAMDALNEKFGRNTVYFGGAHQALHSAPMRIAFNRIPDTNVE